MGIIHPPNTDSSFEKSEISEIRRDETTRNMTNPTGREVNMRPGIIVHPPCIGWHGDWQLNFQRISTLDTKFICICRCRVTTLGDGQLEEEVLNWTLMNAGS
ncbi:hypothetical protein CEXT_165941 [Caerostris extrusa]|uniref:Uncharacterized protein n=1 Tax=Caerostris extrusa TaxID=172846 RepID=A0AAV4UXZ6_CAEEX|nr:hypothetical protein CEXT_165941 [Caerostris extrusa]